MLKNTKIYVTSNLNGDLTFPTFQNYSSRKFNTEVWILIPLQQTDYTYVCAIQLSLPNIYLPKALYASLKGHI